MGGSLKDTLIACSNGCDWASANDNRHDVPFVRIQEPTALLILLF